jgi:hypothetical protein
VSTPLEKLALAYGYAVQGGSEVAAELERIRAELRELAERAEIGAMVQKLAMPHLLIDHLLQHHMCSTCSPHLRDLQIVLDAYRVKRARAGQLADTQPMTAPSAGKVTIRSREGVNAEIPLAQSDLDDLLTPSPTPPPKRRGRK